jgi:quercetin 2,3-dioxygenase
LSRHTGAAETGLVTYVVSGTLTHDDSFGHRAGITAGEMQHISAGSRGMIHSEENLHDEVEHNYQMWLVPERTGTAFAYHQKKFTPVERQGRFRLYTSPDGRDGSMPLNADARIFAGLFATGDRAAHALGPGRGAWIQVVRGTVLLADVTLAQGDGAAGTDTNQLALEFDADSEVLLFDVRLDAPLIWR